MKDNQLREARIKLGISQQGLAEKLHVSQPTVSNWETGRQNPSPEQEKGLLEVLGITSTSSPITFDASALAAWLGNALRDKKWSIPELAHHSGVTAPAIYRIQSGITRNLRSSTREKLERALELKVPKDTEAELKREAEITDLGVLEDFDPHDKKDLPSGPGIYVFYDISDRPIYVGQGDDVGKRIIDHFEKFWFKPAYSRNSLLD